MKMLTPAALIPPPAWLARRPIHPYTDVMDSRNLTVALLDAIFAKLALMSHCPKKLENWMHHVCFPAYDALFKLVEPAGRLIAGVTRDW